MLDAPGADAVHDLVGRARDRQRPVLAVAAREVGNVLPPPVHEPAVAPARPAAADVLLEQHDARARHPLGQEVGGPHAGVSAADDRDVGVDLIRRARGAGAGSPSAASASRSHQLRWTPGLRQIDGSTRSWTAPVVASVARSARSGLRNRAVLGAADGTTAGNTRVASLTMSRDERRPHAGHRRRPAHPVRPLRRRAEGRAARRHGGARHPRAVERTGIDPRAHRRRDPGRREPGRRGQPQRRAHGRAARRAADRGRRPDGQPPVRLRASRRW